MIVDRLKCDEVSVSGLKTPVSKTLIRVKCPRCLIWCSFVFVEAGLWLGLVPNSPQCISISSSTDFHLAVR
jgi:hypothetical protein